MANLLSNAAKFTGRSTTVEVRASRNGNSVAVGVRDRGPGIPEQLKARLFEKFVRLNQSNRDGTGLGLNITRRLVHLMGGDIACVSQPGEGATFTVTFPAARTDETAARAVA
jgi:signal transduction histidine kinase